MNKRRFVCGRSTRNRKHTLSDECDFEERDVSHDAHAAVLADDDAGVHLRAMADQQPLRCVDPVVALWFAWSTFDRRGLRCARLLNQLVVFLRSCAVVFEQRSEADARDLPPVHHVRCDGIRFARVVARFLFFCPVLCFCRVMRVKMLFMCACASGEGHFSSLTPQGNRPWYKLNGPAAYFVSHGIVFALNYLNIFRVCAISLSLVASFVHSLTHPLLFSSMQQLSWLYVHFGEFLASASLASLLFCVFLYFKGIYFPSSNDSGATGHGFIWVRLRWPFCFVFRRQRLNF